jgi:small-conductance mechanosensitive channel
MAPSTVVVLLILAAIVLTPLVREWRDLRRSFGLSPIAAFATTGLVLPAFGMAMVTTLPLAAHPAAQWVTTVAMTLVVYSAAIRAIAASASRPEIAPSRSTRG